MRTLPILAWLAYIGLAFVYRTYVQVRTTGRTGLAVLQGSSQPIDRFVSTLLTASLVLGFASACSSTPPFFALLREPSVLERGAALLVYAAGLAATLVAQLAMGKSWRIGVDRSERTDLVVAGPFRIVRNPIFSGMLVTGLGLALLVPSPASFTAFVFLVVAIEVQVRRVEEPHLARLHGHAYLAYAARTGRFVPGIGRLAAR
jgi:protein-S-isoprenylcysteine O-methyltransferase Ste14